MDARVIHGADNLLSRKLVRAIFFENNKMQAKVGDSLFDTVRYLDSKGYKCYLFGAKDPILLNNKCRFSEIFTAKETLNVLALPIN